MHLYKYCLQYIYCIHIIRLPVCFPIADSRPSADFCKSCHIDTGETYHIGRRWVHNTFPSSDSILKVLQLKTYFWPFDLCASFSHMMEAGLKCICKKNATAPVQLHAQVHVNIAGTFNPVATAPYDSLFVMHHSQIDRLFELWLRTKKPPTVEYPNFSLAANQCRDCRIAGFYPIVTHKDVFVDSRHIGYDYDNFDFGRLKTHKLFKYAAKDFIYKENKCLKAYWNLV